jgi:polygalacturonase
MIKMTTKHYLTTGIRLAILAIFSGTTLLAQEHIITDIKTVNFPKDTLSIDDLGGIGDGQFMNTDIINQAILTTNKKGGGVVTIPQGLWLTGPIALQSHVNLHLERGAVLLFSDNLDDYKLVESNWEGEPSWRNQNPISGKNLENIAITGSGTIDGNGQAWRMVKKSKMTTSQWKNLTASGGVVDQKNGIWYPSESSMRGAQQNQSGRILPGTSQDHYNTYKDYLRPNLLALTSCKRILLEGVTFQNSPAWNLHPLMCTDLTLRDIAVRNPWYAQNGDGLDIESCRNVLVDNCTFDVGDDGICIKSGRDQAGRDRAMPTENVVIRNSVVYHAHGGFVIGSEMSGGARNIWVENCSFIGTDIGLRFKTKRGRGGLVENIHIKNINMANIPGEAILFDMYYDTKDIAQAAEQQFPVTEETPQFQNFHIENIHVKGAKTGIFFRGLPEMHMIEASNITLKDITLHIRDTKPLAHIHSSKNITFDNIKSTNDIEVLVEISGKSEDITIQNTTLNHVKQPGSFQYPATANALTIK